MSKMRIVLIELLVLLMLVSTASATVTYSGGVASFDSGANLATLLSDTANVSLMSESGGVYTMHVPYTQTADFTFTIDAPLKLKSNNDGNEAILTLRNATFNGATVSSWDSVTTLTAPNTDTTRAKIVYTASTTNELVYNSTFTNLGVHRPGQGLGEYGISLQSLAALSVNNSDFVNCSLTVLDGVNGGSVTNSTFNTSNVFLNSQALVFDNNDVVGYVGLDSDYSDMDISLVNDDIVASNNTISLYNKGFYTTGEGCIVRDNIISDCYGGGINGYTGSMSTSDNIISGCQYGIIMVYNAVITSTDDTIYDSSSRGIDGLSSVTRALVYSNGGCGISYSTTVTDSRSYNNGECGISATTITNSTAYDNSEYGIKGTTVTNSTAYNNTEYGIQATTATSCNVSDYGGSYYDYYVSGTDTILDNVNSSNYFGIYASGTAYIKSSTDNYNVSYKSSGTSAVTHNPKIGTDAFNFTVAAGVIDTTTVYNLDADTQYVVLYSNGTAHQSLTSDGSGTLIITEDMTVGTYGGAYGYDNFTWSDMSVTPSSITTAGTSTILCTVDDYDGTILTAYANVGGVNKTMTSIGGGAWSYTFSSSVVDTYAVLFYAQDNHGYWNTTNPSLSISVTAAPSTGGGGTTPITCAGVTCASHCVDTTYYYNGRCIDDICVYDSQTDHPECTLPICEGVTCEPFCLDGIYNFNGVCGFDGDCKFDSRVDAEMCPLIECDGIVCAAWCDGTTYNFNGTCINDVCTFTTEENHPNCPPPEDVIDVWDMVKNLFFLALIIIIFVAAYNEVLSK